MVAYESMDESNSMRTVEKVVESMFFVDLNEDSFMPMNVLAMVELSDCRCDFFCFWV
jgi:hypothetical protein